MIRRFIIKLTLFLFMSLGFANTALAQDTITTATGATNILSNPNDWTVLGVAGTQPNNDPTSLVILTQPQDLNFDASIGNLGTLNLFGFDGQKVFINASNQLEGIVSDTTNAMVLRAQAANGGVALPDGGNAGARANFEVSSDGAIIEFAGNELDGLGDVSLPYVNSTIKFSADNSAINGSIGTTNGGNGIIYANAHNIQFNGAIGGNAPINWLRLEDNASVILNNDAAFQAGGLNFNDNTNLTLNAGRAITFSNSARINFDGNGVLRLSGDQDRSLVTNITGNNNNGAIIYEGTAGKVLNLHGQIGNSGSSMGRIDLTSGGTLKFSSDYNSDSYIDSIDMGATDGTIILKQSSLHINNFTHSNNLGAIIITDEGISTGNASTTGFSGPLLGASGNPIKKLQFYNSGGGAFVNVLGIMEQADIYANSIESNTPNTGVLLFFQGSNIIDAPIGSGTFPLAAMVLNNDTTVEVRQDAFFAQQLISAPYEIGLSPGATIKISGNLRGDISGVDSIFTSTPTLSANGTVTYINNAPITHDGDIITSNTVEIAGDNVSIAGNIGATNLNFTSDKQFKLTGNSDKVVKTSNINANNIGSIIADDMTSGKKMEIVGYIGNPTNKLKMITARGGGNIEFKSWPNDTDPRSTHIQSIDISGNDGAVIFNGGEHSGFNLIHDNHKGSLVLQSPHSGSFIQFNNGINLGGANNYLKKILFKEDSTDALFNVLAFPDSVDLYIDSIETDTANKGVMLFGGNSHSINAEIGSAVRPLRFLAVLSNSTSLELKEDAYLAGGLGFYQDGIIKVASNVYTYNDPLFVGGGAFGVDYADISSLIKGTKGTLEFINNNDVVFDGRIDHLNLVKISGGNVSVTRAVSLNNLNFSNVVTSSTLTFNDTADIYGATTAGNSMHNITFEHTTNINGNIGTPSNKFSSITFANDYNKPSLLAANIYSSTIVADNARIIFNDDVVIKSDIQGINTHADFRDKKFTYEGHAVLRGSPVFYTTFIPVVGGNHRGGHIELTGNSTLDFSATNNAKIILTASSPTPPINDPYSYILFEQNGGTVVASPVIFEPNENNRYVAWSYNPQTYVLTGVNNPNVLGDVINGGGNSNNIAVAEALNDSNITGDAVAIQNEFGFMDSASVNNAINGLTPVDLSGGALAEASDLAEKNTEERISSQILSSQLFSANNDVGISAGDDKKNGFGIWIAGIYGKAIQKSFALESGYKSRSFGMTLGIDKLINDDLVLGAALSNINTIVNHSSLGASDGNDKGRASSNILSGYVIKMFPHNLFIQGIAYAGLAKLQNLEQRIINNSTILYAHSKYNSFSYGAKLVAGKKCYMSKDFVLVPSIGLRYNYSRDSGYKETGAAIQNLTVSSKSSYDLEGIIGGSIYTLKTFNDITIKPELQAYINYNIKSKSLAMHIGIDGIINPIKITGNRSSKAWYSLGGGIGVMKNAMEYNLLYESEIDKKYISHQAMLKIKINL